jgi:DNA-binding transcriptional LysR family regulator
MIEELHWPLTVLSRAIQYKNLTAASQHVGLSQPQLSRLISKLEGDLGLLLLDRSSPRKAHWTPIAQKLAKLYSEASRSLTHSIEELKDGDRPSRLAVACLEGLSPLALAYGKEVLEKTSVAFLHLDVFDLHELEAKFMDGDLDVIFTSRVPGKKKFLHQCLMGHQGFERVDQGSHFQVFSPFEYDQKKSPQPSSEEKHIVSNSLYLRREWLQKIGGRGKLPGPVVSRASASATSSVIVLGADNLNRGLWQLVEELRQN